MKKIPAKRVAFYGFLTAAALLFGYVEQLLPLDFIAPGIKLGMANGIFLLLLLVGRVRTAFAVNTVRILLSALLFAAPSTLIFSLSGGLLSMVVAWGMSKIKAFGVVGISTVGGVMHNIAQLTVAFFTVGRGVWFYAPFLLVAGIVAGIAVGILVWCVDKALPKKTFSF